MAVSNSELPKKPGVSRRDFLKIAALAFPAAVIACDDSQSQPFSPGLGITRTPTLPMSDYMEATKQAVERKGASTSFVPEGLFTQEFFTQVNRSTFKILFTWTDLRAEGTCWCIAKAGNLLTLVNTAHGIHPDQDHQTENTTAATIYRPHIDPGPQPAIIRASTKHPHPGEDFTYDQSLVVVEVSPEFAESIEPLPHVDDYKPQIEESILTVGHPHHFYTNRPENLPITAGSISKIKKVSSLNWVTDTVNSGGSSGSPAVIPDANNQPLVVGLLAGFYDNLTAELAAISPYPIIIIPLKITQLFKSLNELSN